MKKPHQLLKQTGRVIASVNVLFNLGTTPKLPDLQTPARAQELQSQWAKNEKTSILPSWRTRSRELGYQLREPDSAERRPRDEPSSQSVTDRERAKDAHEQALSRRPARGADLRGTTRRGRSRAARGSRQPGGRDGQSR